MNVNHQLEMERTIEALRRRGERPRLLLHACCAPCSSAVLERLEADFRLTVLYYNPNIEPMEEWESRYAELEKLLSCTGRAGEIPLIRGPWHNERFREMARGLEDMPEGGERCTRCFALRLGYTVERAAAEGFDYAATTLTISPMKDAARLNAIGSSLARNAGVAWLFSDFKKKDGYRRSCALSREYGLYRQDYCGCVFSRQESQRRRAGRP